MSPTVRGRGRATTIVAAGVLVLDGVLLGLAGLWGRRYGLLLGAGVCLLAAVGVGLLWRRYQRQLAEVEAARIAVREEVLALRALVRGEYPE